MGSIADRLAAKQRTGALPKARFVREAEILERWRAENRRSFGTPSERAAQREADRTALKGTYLGNCNVTACQSPGATWWNKAMGKWYCRSCAKKINAPGWPLGDKTPIICFDRGIYVEHWSEVWE